MAFEKTFEIASFYRTTLTKALAESREKRSNADRDVLDLEAKLIDLDRAVAALKVVP